MSLDREQKLGKFNGLTQSGNVCTVRFTLDINYVCLDYLKGFVNTRSYVLGVSTRTCSIWNQKYADTRTLPLGISISFTSLSFGKWLYFIYLLLFISKGLQVTWARSQYQS